LTVLQPACRRGVVMIVEGNDLEATGVKPDIYVRTTFGDMQKGVDPQLEKAVKEALQALGTRQ